MERHNGRSTGGKGDLEREKEEQLRSDQEEDEDELGEREEERLLKHCSYTAAVEVTRTLLGEEDSKRKGVFRLLQQLAFTEGGFLCSSFRAVLFPILLGCSSPCLTSWRLVAFLRARQLLLRELKPGEGREGERVRRRFERCGNTRSDCCRARRVKEEKPRDNIASHHQCVAKRGVAGSSDSLLKTSVERVKRRGKGKEGRGQESSKKKTRAPLREGYTGGGFEEEEKHNSSEDKVVKEAIQSHLYMCAWTGLTRCLESSSPVSSYLRSCCFPGSQPSLPERKEMERKTFSEFKNEHKRGGQRGDAVALTKGRKKEIYDMLRRGMTEYKGAGLIVFFVNSFEETPQLSNMSTRGGDGIPTLVLSSGYSCLTGVETESWTRRQEKLKDGREEGQESWINNNSNASFSRTGNEEREGEKGSETNGDEEVTFLVDSLQRAGIRIEVRNGSPRMEKAKMASSSFSFSGSSSPHVSHPSRLWSRAPMSSSSDFPSLSSFHLKRPSSADQLLAEKRAWEAEGYLFLPEAERAQIRKDVIRSMRQWRLPEGETQGSPNHHLLRRCKRDGMTVHDTRQTEKNSSSAEEVVDVTNRGEGKEVGSSLMMAQSVDEEMERQSGDSVETGEGENSAHLIESRPTGFTSAGHLSRDARESSPWMKEEGETRQVSSVGAAVEKITTQFEDDEEEIEGKTGRVDGEKIEDHSRETTTGEGDYRKRRTQLKVVQDTSEKRDLGGEEDERTGREEGKKKNEKRRKEEMENGEGGDEDVICLRDTLEKILCSIVARHYSRLFYTQGMHDIAGAILLLLMHAGRFLLLAFQARKGRSFPVGNPNISSSSSPSLRSLWSSHHLIDFLSSSSAPSSSICSFSSFISSYPSLVAYLSSLAFSLTERLYLFHLCDFFAASLEASLLPALSLLSLFLGRYDPCLHTVFSCASIAAIDEKSSRSKKEQITGSSQKEEESDSSQQDEDDDVDTVTSSTDSVNSRDEDSTLQDEEENEAKGERMQTASARERDCFRHNLEEEKSEDALMNEGSNTQALSIRDSSSSSFFSPTSPQVTRRRQRRRQLGNSLSSRSSSSPDAKKKKKDGGRSTRGMRMETEEMAGHSDRSSPSVDEEETNRSGRERIIGSRRQGEKQGKKEIHRRDSRFSTETSTSRSSTPSAFSPVPSPFPEDLSSSCSSSSLAPVSSPFRSSGLEFQPCTSWLITFFAHSFSSFPSLCRYLDCALTSHPLFSLHFAAVVISFHRMQIFQAFQDLLEASTGEGEFLPEELENFLTSLRQRQARESNSSHHHQMQRRDSRNRGGEGEAHAPMGSGAEDRENHAKKSEEPSETDEESLISQFDATEELNEEKEKTSERRERRIDVRKKQKRRRTAEERCEIKKEEEKERDDDVLSDVVEQDALRHNGELVARKLMEDQWRRLFRQEEAFEREKREEEGRRNRRLLSFLRFREKKEKAKDLISDRGLLEDVRDRLGDSISVKLHSIIQNIHFDALPLDDLLHETCRSSCLDEEDGELSVHWKEILRQAKRLNIRLPPFSPVYNYPYPWMKTKKNKISSSSSFASSSFSSPYIFSFLSTASATSLRYPLDILHQLPPPPEESEECRSDFYQSSDERLEVGSSFSCEGSRDLSLSNSSREETNQRRPLSSTGGDHPKNHVSSGSQPRSKDEEDFQCKSSQRNELDSSSSLSALTQEQVFSSSSFSSASALEFTIPPPYLYLPTTGEDTRVSSYSEEECEGSLTGEAEASDEVPQRQKRASRSSLAKKTVQKYPSHWICVYKKVPRHDEKRKKKRHSRLDMRKKELKRRGKSIMLSPFLFGKPPPRGAPVSTEEEEGEGNVLRSIFVWIVVVFFFQPLVTLCQWILDLFFAWKEPDGLLPSVTHTTMMRECQRRMRSVKYEQSLGRKTVEKRDKKKKE